MHSEYQLVLQLIQWDSMNVYALFHPKYTSVQSRGKSDGADSPKDLLAWEEAMAGVCKCVRGAHLVAVKQICLDF